MPTPTPEPRKCEQDGARIVDGKCSNPYHGHSPKPGYDGQGWLKDGSEGIGTGRAPKPCPNGTCNALTERGLPSLEHNGCPKPCATCDKPPCSMIKPWGCDLDPTVGHDHWGERDNCHGHEPLAAINGTIADFFLSHPKMTVNEEMAEIGRLERRLMAEAWLQGYNAHTREDETGINAKNPYV